MLDTFLNNFKEQLTLPVIVAVVSAIAAVISAISAWRSSCAARKNLRITQAEFEERHDSIRAHLIDSISWDSPKGERIASFACSYSNAANAPNTLVRFELIVHGINSDGSKITVVLDPTMDNIPSQKGMSQLSVPLNLQARSTLSGWISFMLPAHLINTKRIDKYQVIAVTSTGKALILDCYLLSKRQNEI